MMIYVIHSYWLLSPKHPSPQDNVWEIKKKYAIIWSPSKLLFFSLNTSPHLLWSKFQSDSEKSDKSEQRPNAQLLSSPLKLFWKAGSTEFISWLLILHKEGKEKALQKKKKLFFFEIFLPPIKRILNRTSKANIGNPHHTYLQSQLQQIHIFPDKVQRLHVASAIRDI